MNSTILINCSPKRRMSASGFLAHCAGWMIRGEKKVCQLRTPADFPAILDALRTADKVIFVTPLYVDSLPSHVLPFLQKMEAFCRENRLQLKVYAIANNGFIEGRQNEPLMQVLENFCARSGLTWCGGIGIGGGVMLNVERIMLTVLLGLTLLNVILGMIQGENPWEPVKSFAISAGELLLLACGIIVLMLRLTLHVNRGTDAGKRYTRIMVPSFLFILFADIFFTILSVLQGGMFRGWLSRPKPKESGSPAAAGEP
jgi:multimeric flavodoxin WrbA